LHSNVLRGHGIRELRQTELHFARTTPADRPCPGHFKD
jgi:hypothetical protein